MKQEMLISLRSMLQTQFLTVYLNHIHSLKILLSGFSNQFLFRF